MKTETLKSYLRPLYHCYVSLRYSRRANKINDDYAAHSRHAREGYLSDGNTVQPSLSSLDDVQVTPLFPISEEQLFISYPDNYSELVKHMQFHVDSRLQFAANCSYIDEDGLAPSNMWTSISIRMIINPDLSHPWIHLAIRHRKVSVRGRT
jgi:hypothetical protein